MKQVLVLIPGIMGSVLMDGNDVVWPGTLGEYIGTYNRMTSLLKPDLVATDVIRKLGLIDQYHGLITSLGRAYLSEADGTLRVYPYDWRKDNALAAAGLADLIDQLIHENDANVEVTLLAHSMGGLVARSYLESPLYQERIGLKHVRTLVTMGTPHRGAPMALAAAVGLEKRLWLSADQVKMVANDENFPSLYQLIPPQGEPFVWTRAADKRSIPLDIYDAALALKLGLSQNNLLAAQRFHKTLNLANKPEHVRYFTFTGNLKTTVHAMEIISFDGRSSQLRRRERASGGDGTVPIWSAALPGTQGELVDGTHGTVFHDTALKYLLGNLLGYEGNLSKNEIAIVVKDQIADSDAQTEISIELANASEALNGRFRVRYIADQTGEPLEDNESAWADWHQIRYEGPLIRRLDLFVIAPKYPGVYELDFVREGGVSSEAVSLLVRMR